MRVFVIRHGERSRVPFEGLSPRGKQQAAQTAQRLGTASIQKILASPTHRTQETAQILGEKLGREVFTEDRLAQWSAPRMRVMLNELESEGVSGCILVTHLPVIRALFEEADTIADEACCTPWSTLSELKILEASVSEFAWENGKLELFGAAQSEHLTA